MSPRGLHLRKNETTLGTIYLTGVTRKLTVAQALKRANMGCSLPYKYLMAVVSSSDLSFLHLQTKKVRKKKTSICVENPEPTVKHQAGTE